MTRAGSRWATTKASRGLRGSRPASRLGSNKDAPPKPPRAGMVAVRMDDRDIPARAWDATRQALSRLSNKRVLLKRNDHVPSYIR